MKIEYYNLKHQVQSTISRLRINTRMDLFRGNSLQCAQIDWHNGVSETKIGLRRLRQKGRKSFPDHMSNSITLIDLPDKDTSISTYVEATGSRPAKSPFYEGEAQKQEHSIAIGSWQLA